MPAMPNFFALSASGQRVSLLNDVDIEPRDALMEHVAHAVPPHEQPPAPPRKKHQCPLCGKNFTTSGHLTRHVKVHSGDKNYECPFPSCGKRCSRHDNLLQHYKSHLSKADRECGSAHLRAVITDMRDAQSVRATEAAQTSSSPSTSSSAMSEDDPPSASQHILPSQSGVAAPSATREASSPSMASASSPSLSPASSTYPFTFVTAPASSSLKVTRQEMPATHVFIQETAPTSMSHSQGYEVSFMRADR